MSKFFIKFLFFAMASVMLVTACGAGTATAYPNPTAYPDPTDEPLAALSTATEPPAAPGPVSFSADILPILEKSCANCHGGNRTEKGLDLSSYEALMNGSEKGAVVMAGDADNSTLVTLVASGKMPKRGSKLTPEQIELIIAWINAGAPNN
ncbi:MAG: c-type cytochrome domain-containing protein [Chloroflexota bacterium]